MKTNLFFLSTLATVALVGCNKEPDPIDGNVPAVLQVQLADTQGSKASGAPVEATETSIKKGMIFVFKGMDADPALDGKASFDFTSSNVVPVTVNITQGIRQVYVVANVNPADFTAINNLSDLQHVSNKLTLAAFRTSGSLPMSGFVNNVDVNSSSKAVSVNLVFIGARVHIDWDVSNLNSGLTGLTIDGAAILNAHGSSEYIATDNGSGGYNPLTHNLFNYFHGLTSATGFTGSYLPSVGLGVSTSNDVDPALWVPVANKGFDQNYNYVFENGSPKSMIIAIKGTHNSTTYYWPIVINGALNGIGGVNAGDQSGSVKRGMIYKVKAVIKGLGNTDPYTPINPATMDVTIIPAAWLATIQIDQQFN